MRKKHVKLTKAQREALRELAITPRFGIQHYLPLVNLVALGLMTERPGGMFPVYTITDAGRAHPAATQGDTP